MHELEDGELVIGRSRESGLKLADESLSRRHAHVFRRGGALLFEDLVRLALAELATEARALLRDLDPRRPLIVTADHGFRLAPDLRRYVHGGPSTLERLVPVIELQAG